MYIENYTSWNCQWEWRDLIKWPNSIHVRHFGCDFILSTPHKHYAILLSLPLHSPPPPIACVVLLCDAFRSVTLWYARSNNPFTRAQPSPSDGIWKSHLRLLRTYSILIKTLPPTPRPAITWFRKHVPRTCPLRHIQIYFVYYVFGVTH